MRALREVLRLFLEQKLSQRAIARSCCISSSTVNGYVGRAKVAKLTWPLPDELDDAALSRLLFPDENHPRNDRPEPDWARVHLELRKKHVTKLLLWEEYKSEQPDGYQYSQFCERYGQWLGRVSVVMRQEHRVGEKLFVDFSGDGVDIVDPRTGEVSVAKLFVAVLGASNYTYVEPVLNEALPTWLAAHVNAFDFFGGVPELVVPDNLLSGVTKANRYEPTLNQSYAELARHYGVAVIPARVRKPRDKAKVEQGVLLAERWILAALRSRTFYSLAEVKEAVRSLLAKLNERPMRRLELFHQTVAAGEYDEAFLLFVNRLWSPLALQLAEVARCIPLLTELFPEGLGGSPAVSSAHRPNLVLRLASCLSHVGEEVRAVALRTPWVAAGDVHMVEDQAGDLRAVGRLADASKLLVTGLERFSLSQHALGHLHHALAALHLIRGDVGEAEAAASRSEAALGIDLTRGDPNRDPKHYEMALNIRGRLADERNDARMQGRLLRKREAAAMAMLQQSVINTTIPLEQASLDVARACKKKLGERALGSTRVRILEILHTARCTGNANDECAALGTLSSLERAAGNFGLAQEHAAAALTIASRNGWRLVQSDLEYSRGLALEKHGQVDEALGCYRAALKHAECDGGANRYLPLILKTQARVRRLARRDRGAPLRLQSRGRQPSTL